MRAKALEIGSRDVKICQVIGTGRIVCEFVE